VSVIDPITYLAAVSLAQAVNAPPAPPSPPYPAGFTCDLMDQNGKPLGLRALIVAQGDGPVAAGTKLLRAEGSDGASLSFDAKAVTEYGRITFSGTDSKSQSVSGGIIFDFDNGAISIKQEKVEVGSDGVKSHAGYRFLTGFCKVIRS